ncbi:hypothetical protein SH528x_005417 [Novipirellula sp. SH528]|uniref:hypothetical protein n=1 Tax=Novipirellula sp. SH528 TaxID=3454466 RepID=UPI003FA1240B
MVKKLDAVSQRLIASGADHEASVLQWLDGQQQRRNMTKRAIWSTAGGWLLVIASGIVASLVAIKISIDVQDITSTTQGMFGDVETPQRVLWVPYVTVVISILLIGFAVIGILRGALPGYRSTKSAIQWAAASDAVSRLLAAGYTYSEAFTAAASVVKQGTAYGWLNDTIRRLERGESEVGLTSWSRGDAALLEAIVDGATISPERQWQIASDHFSEVAQRRLVLLTQLMPLFSTVVAGGLIWIAVATTLGWFWYTVSSMIGGLT